MPLFQKSVLNKYLQTLNPAEVDKAFQKFKSFYGDDERIENIKLLKEENYQEGFLREIFVDVLGYTINPDKNYTLTTEFKNETDSKKADGAILLEGKAIGVIELKSTKTTDMESIIDQAFNYKNHQTGCKYVITSNFEKLRFYIDNATEYVEFYLFDMDLERFKIFYLLLCSGKLLNGIPAKIKKESQLHEENISDKLYKDYSEFKYKIYRNLVKNNPQYDKLILFKKSQKLLDRILFILFAEDSGLVPPNAISEIIKQYKTFIELDEKKTLYSRFVKFFHHLNVGHKYSKFEVPAYNGGLFKEDEILNNVEIDDEILLEDALKLSSYDFSTEVDVNILGHIFEHSINEIEEITAEIEGEERDASKSKRKKEGVFYTPKYITKYIVENTIGELCSAKKIEFKLNEIDEEILENSKTAKGKLTRKAETLFKNLETYREYILSLKILDPACGSGAFLNQALDFLIEEHKWIDEQRSRLLKESFTIVEYEKDILEHNLYGVDINEEAVEIAKLSLWLRTAKKGRKLSDLSSNIKCGNSLIDDPEVAGDKAFNWEEEFPEIMSSGGFDVVIGNPPYVQSHSISESQKKYYYERYYTAEYQINTYALFVERTLMLLKHQCYYGLIIPNYWLSTKYDQNLRKLTFQKNKILEITNIYNVFKDATVDTLIILGNRTTHPEFPKTSIIKSIDNSLKSIDDRLANLQLGIWKTEKKYLISENQEILNITFEDELALNTSRILQDFFDVYKGMQPYEKGKGIPRQTREMMNNKIYHSSSKIDNTYLPLVTAGCIQKNLLKQPREFIKYGVNLAAPRKKEIFNNPRILVNRIVSRKNIYAVYVEEQLINNTDVFNLIPKKNKEKYIKTLYLIIVSTFCYSYFMKKSVNLNRKAFPKLNVNSLESFPIPELSDDFILDANKLADRVLKLNKHKSDATNIFISRINSNFAFDKFTRKLTEFYNHDFKTFLDELKKKKVTLTLKQQDEWEEYFNEHKEKIIELQTQITQTDREIDQLVYQLYGLTEEEIKIVEESV